MAVKVDSQRLNAGLRTLERETEDKSRVAKSWIGFHAVQSLRGASPNAVRKGWHDTGKQQRSYVFALSPQGRRISIGNFARSKNGYPYPKLNERRYQVAGKVIQANRSQIVRMTKRSLAAGLREYRGSYRRASLSRS